MSGTGGLGTSAHPGAEFLQGLTGELFDRGRSLHKMGRVSSLSSDTKMYLLFLFASTALALCALCLQPSADASEFWLGADLSNIPQKEKLGIQFKAAGVVKDPLLELKESGVNLVRLRVWHSPQDGECGTEQTLAIARRCGELGLKIMIDFHYSDSWADPNKQHKPRPWESLSFSELKTAVHDYTRDVVAALAAQGTPPEIVQVGNEIGHGMLWPDARTGESELQTTQLAELLKAGIAGVHDGAGNYRVRTMLHLEGGGLKALCRWFFDEMTKRGVEFDLIGLSYYNWWHGTFADLSDNVTDLVARFHKDVMIVETSHPWTHAPGRCDHFINDELSLTPGCAATPEGQAKFLREVIELARGAADGHCIGVVYWGGECVSADAAGDSWENMALWDYHYNLLPAASVFHEFAH